MQKHKIFHSMQFRKKKIKAELLIKSEQKQFFSTKWKQKLWEILSEQNLDKPRNTISQVGAAWA